MSLLSFNRFLMLVSTALFVSACVNTNTWSDKQVCFLERVWVDGKEQKGFGGARNPGESDVGLYSNWDTIEGLLSYNFRKRSLSSQTCATRYDTDRPQKAFVAELPSVLPMPRFYNAKPVVYSQGSAAGAYASDQQNLAEAAALAAMAQAVLNSGAAPSAQTFGGVAGGVGVYKGDTTQGHNKICYYDKAGSIFALTIGAAEICPLRAP
jgi:hypothetical protein